MGLKDKRALVVASGAKSSDGRINVLYHGSNGRHFDALVMGPGVVGSAPTGVGKSTATTGGTLAASTYFYRVSAVVNFTETAAASEVSQITTGSTSTVTVTWSAVAGATSYRIYGRATGAELFMASVVGGTLTWLDDGSVTPAGAMPANTLGLKLRVGSNQRIIDNVPLAATMHDINSYYTVF